MNDDPAAMQQVACETCLLQKDVTGVQELFLSIEGGGHVALDWFVFEYADQHQHQHQHQQRKLV